MVSLKTSLISITVLLALSSCGKNKELKANGPAAQTQTVTEPAKPAAEQKKQDEVTPKVEPKKEDPKASEQDKAKDDKAGEEKEKREKKQAPPVIIVTDEEKSEQKVEPKKEQKESKAKPEVKKTVITKLTDIDFEKTVSVKTGGQLKDLAYTGAGLDGLITEFKSTADAASKEQQALDVKLAKSILATKLTKTGSADLIIDMVVEETVNGHATASNVRLKASSSDKLSSLVLISQPTAGSKLAFQGGYIKCLDLDGSCETAYAKIKVSGAYATVIFRKTYANAHFLIQEKISNNVGFDIMKKYILNRKNEVETTEKIQNVQVSSYEIVNGRSAMGLQVVTADKKMIGLSIPLVSSAKNSVVAASVLKSSDISRSYDLTSSAGYASDLSQLISDVQLIGNTGLGQLKLKLSFMSGANSGNIWMLVAAKQKAQMSLQQVREFESSVAKF